MKLVIEGCIAQDKDNWEPPRLFTNEPTWDEEDWEYGPVERWRDKECIYVENKGGIILPDGSFPDLKWENSPRKVKITIETIE